MTSLAAAAAILSSVAGAEDRLSLEKLRDAVCASADANGETHRPYVCDPRCGCAPHPLTTEINNNDALEWIATIEAAIGQPCTPVSP